VSIGVATMSEEIITSEALIDSADRALYRSKQAGRNCVNAGGVNRESWIVNRGSWIVDRGSWIVNRES
jgi:predicted signal transduction protein with EAL and GGDEF domain